MAQLSRLQGRMYRLWVPRMLGLQWRLSVQQWVFQTARQSLSTGHQSLTMAQRSPALLWQL
jgi:hypothetical protein